MVRKCAAMTVKARRRCRSGNDEVDWYALAQSSRIIQQAAIEVAPTCVTPRVHWKQSAGRRTLVARLNDMMTSRERFISNVASHVSFMPIFGRRLPRAIGSARAWSAALTSFGTRLGRSAGACAAELRARRAINYLRSLDDDRLRDLGIRRKEDIEHFVRFGRD
jgi:uncharacterized protein YjiS (DUF1127 family)